MDQDAGSLRKNINTESHLMRHKKSLVRAKCIVWNNINKAKSHMNVDLNAGRKRKKSIFITKESWSRIILSRSLTLECCN